MISYAWLQVSHLWQRLVRHLSVIGVCLVVMGTASFAQAEQAGWVGDVPVPTSAIIDTTNAVSFDSPAGVW